MKAREFTVTQRGGAPLYASMEASIGGSISLYTPFGEITVFPLYVGPATDVQKQLQKKFRFTEEAIVGRSKGYVTLFEGCRLLMAKV